MALLSSAFIYLNFFGISYPFLNTLLGILSLYLLLKEEEKTWFYFGAFVGLFWFWWIVISFKHYEMLWAIPIGLVMIALIYGVVFWFIAKIASLTVGCIYPANSSTLKVDKSTLLSLCIKGLGLLLLSYLHPFGFDWLKLELMFVESYIGIEKWQFLVVLLALILTLGKRKNIYLILIFLAYQPTDVISHDNSPTKEKIELISTHTTVQDKWNTALQPTQFELLFAQIDQAIEENKTLVILPESVFPLFLNHSQTLIDKLQKRAKKIDIVTGGLYWDGKVPHNSTYIFRQNKISVAHKVKLVPFGESNPLPDFLSDWVNKVFYDGAIDYQASANITDYKVGELQYRNAICFEATSEALYAKNKKGNYPKNMIVLSNNGWFTPSTEPTLQKLLLMYYSKKYGTTIYHAVNMSESYIIKDGKVRD